MGLLSGIVMYAGKQVHPFFSPQRCMNRKQTKHPCRVCTQSCLSGALPDNFAAGEIDWDKCTNCGICITACPSRCFSPDLNTQKNLAVSSGGDTVVFACLHGELTGTVSRVECLCSIPWEWLAALALRMQVVLFIGKCGECSKEECRKQMEANLHLLCLFLGKERMEKSLVLADRPDQIRQLSSGAQMNRRDFFQMFTKGIRKSVAFGVTGVMPMQGDDPAKNGFIYRKLLADIVAQEYETAIKNVEVNEAVVPQPLPSYEVMLPDFNENCFGCGMCARVCPQKALSVLEDGADSRIISVSPWKCTGCGLCSKICIHKGIHGMTKHSVHHMGMQGYVRVYHAKCSRCGAVIPVDRPDGLCIACAARKKRRF